MAAASAFTTSSFSSTVGQIDSGFELVSTNGAPATFTVNNFSITSS